ncbi:MAG: hypothetical protein PHN75_12765 [Syntrophales bacterium]|nr:hypothetical protein [Syntrophales bacterium]
MLVNRHLFLNKIKDAWKRPRYYNIFLLGMALFISAHVLMFYALPVKTFLVILAILAVFFCVIDSRNAMLVSISLVIVTAMFGGFLKITDLSRSMFRTPQEMFSVHDAMMGHSRFKRNIRFDMILPYGDLKAMAPQATVLPEPRRNVFETDSFGYRNTCDYHGQEYVLVGDSFTLGDGVTQRDIITEQLLRKYGIDTYNLAHAGGMDDYIKYLNTFLETFGKNHKAILLIFEGNDFPDYRDATINHEAKYPWLRFPKMYYNLFSQTDIFRFTKYNLAKINLLISPIRKERVAVRNVGNIPVAFYTNYIDVTKREFLPDNPDIESSIQSLKDHITHVVFIPTKYRVYYHLLEPKGPALPDQQWAFTQRLCRKFGIKAINLTPMLIEESDRLLPQGLLTSWRDDTHWNGYGVAVAARVLAQEVFETRGRR